MTHRCLPLNAKRQLKRLTLRHTPFGNPKPKPSTFLGQPTPKPEPVHFPYNYPPPDNPPQDVD